MALREPCEFTRSPTIVGRGDWTSGVAAIIELTCAGRRCGRGLGARPPVRSLTRSAIASMWAGVVPQQPPTIETP